MSLDAMIVILIFCVAAILMILSIHKEAYKMGQVDALNGEQKYHLIEFKDGTRDYYHNKELPDLEDGYKIIK